MNYRLDLLKGNVKNKVLENEITDFQKTNLKPQKRFPTIFQQELVSPVRSRRHTV